MSKEAAAKEQTAKQPAWKAWLPVVGLPLFVVAIYLIFQFSISFCVAIIFGERIYELQYSAVFNTVIQAISATLIMIVVLLLPKYVAKTKIKRAELGLEGLPTWTDILLSPVGFIIYTLLGALLMSIIASIFPGLNLNEAQEVGFQAENLVNVSDKLLAAFTLIIVAPVTEEIIFRGFLYSQLKLSLSKAILSKKKIARFLPAILASIITSVAFGFLHGQWNVAIITFAMSLVMCVQREITGTIYSSILLHMIKNGVAFYLLFINPIV